MGDNLLFERFVVKGDNLLFEHFVVKGEILEDNKEELPKGILCRAKYPICNIGEKNRNNRIYGESLWENVYNDPNVKDMLDNRTMYMQEEHPDDGISTVTSRIAGVVNKIYTEGNKVYCECDVLDTPYGKIINTLLEAKCGIGVSTRAAGSLEPIEEDTDCYNVIPEEYEFKAIDFTADPSTYGAYPETVEHVVVDIIGKSINEQDDNKIDLVLAKNILSKMKSKKAVSLLESIKDKGVTVNNNYFEDVYTEICKDVRLKESINIDDYNNVLESSTIKGLVNNLSNIIKINKLKYCNIVAEKDCFSEHIDSIDKYINELKESYSNDIIELTENNNKFKNEILKIEETINNKVINALDEEKNNKDSECLDIVSIYENKIKKVVKKTVNDTSNVYNTKLKDLVEKYENKIKSITDEFSVRIYKKNVDLKILESGLDFTDEMRDRLYETKSIKDVDNIINKYKVDVKENILHGSFEVDNVEPVRENNKDDIIGTNMLKRMLPGIK
jgi:hypothetical protein